MPLGAFGISCVLLDLYFARSGPAPLAGLDIAGFLQQPGSWRIVMDLTGIGLFAGFFVVPLFALIQSRTPRGELSRVIAGMNIQNAALHRAARRCSASWCSVSLAGRIPQVFLALAIANALVAIYIFTLVPEFLMRFLSWVLVRALYRLRVRGIEEHVPDEGPALIVCNHVSYMDALILAASIPRPVRFVMYYKIFNIPVMRWIFRNAKAIPIAGARENPELMQRAFDAIDQALAEGEIVGIFPEGRLTRDGEIAPFKSGIERVLRARRREAAGAGGADGAARHVAQHVEPPRFAPGSHARAAAVPGACGGGGGCADRRSGCDCGSAGSEGARVARGRGIARLSR